MRYETNHPSRRALLKLTGIALAAAVVDIGNTAEEPPATSLFDGNTLDGWIQIENSATSMASGGITDPASFAAKLTAGTDAISVFLRDRLQSSEKSDLAAYSPASANAKAVIAALVKDL
jgi:hypothetical protein